MAKRKGKNNKTGGTKAKPEGPAKEKEHQARTDTETSSFQCPICGMTFDTQDELLDHERTHMGERIGKTATSDRAPEETKGNLSDRGNETLPWGEERRGWTTGTGDREEGEITGRQTPGGRNPGFSSD